MPSRAWPRRRPAETFTAGGIDGERVRQLRQADIRSFRGSDGLTYVFAVPDMKVYLNNAYDDAENSQGHNSGWSRASRTDPGFSRSGEVTSEWGF